MLGHDKRYSLIFHVQVAKTNLSLYFHILVDRTTDIAGVEETGLSLGLGHMDPGWQVEGGSKFW